MALILNIDSSMETASICLSSGGAELLLKENSEQKEHASWLHVAISRLLEETGYRVRDMQAVAVTSGPGSFTGLRVGMATAKGLCYALGIPMITENTLKLMAFAAAKQEEKRGSLLCPMIDARRQEVFTALYTRDLVEIIPPTAMLLDENSFADRLSSQSILFFGSGARKWKPLCGTYNSFFADVNCHAGFLGILADLKFKAGDFTGILNSEPVYTKEFYTHIKK